MLLDSHSTRRSRTPGGRRAGPAHGCLAAAARLLVWRSRVSCHPCRWSACVEWSSSCGLVVVHGSAVVGHSHRPQPTAPRGSESTAPGAPTSSTLRGRCRACLMAQNHDCHTAVRPHWRPSSAAKWYGEHKTALPFWQLERVRVAARTSARGHAGPGCRLPGC